MTNEQLYLVIGIPLLGNAVLFGLLMAYINAKIDEVNGRLGGLRTEMNERFNGVYERFNGVYERFNAVYERFNGMNDRFASINQRFDDMRDLWRAELGRVEEVLDARLKHFEERG